MIGCLRLSSGLLCAGSLLLATPLAHADTLAGQEVRLDRDLKLLAWSEPQDRAYDTVMRASWNRLQTWPTVEENGLKTYVTYPAFDPLTLKGRAELHVPATHNASTTDAAIRYFAYTGDPTVLDVARELLDHHLAQGLSPADWVYGSFPFASSDAGSVEYSGASGDTGRGDGIGNTEPDKGAELGYALLQLYGATGDGRYRDAAIRIADTLVKTRREGDGMRSPWPFRVNAKTGAANEEYTAHGTTTLQLFDELIRLDIGDGASYRTARAAEWAWLLAYPFKTSYWSNAFEDQPYLRDPTKDPTQYIPLKLAQYILERPEHDPDYALHLAGILPWVEANFGIDTPTEKGIQYGATVVSERALFMAKMGNHTARYASVAALWAERTGDLAYREKAFRSLNWATYVCRVDGLVSADANGTDWRFVTGYGDYIRNFMTALGAAPSFAPPGESHILRSSSIVTSVTYAPTAVSYQTFHNGGIDVFRVAFEPGKVTADGRVLERRPDLSEEGFMVEDLGGNDRALRIRHDTGRAIAIQAVTPTTAPGSTSVPPNVQPYDAGGGGCSTTSASLAAWPAALSLLLVLRRRRR